MDNNRRNVETVFSVPVRVTKVGVQGISVELLSQKGKNGFIRRREVSWDRSLRVSVELPREGEELKAVILEELGGKLYLSLKRVEDPWDNAVKEKKYKVGQIITGEVVNVRHRGVYVQIEPGIDGVLYPRDLSFISENIEDILWVGDKIRAKIVEYTPEQKLIELSILNVLWENQSAKRESLLERFEVHSSEVLTAYRGNVQSNEEIIFSSPEPVIFDKPEPVLIVDDDEVWARELKVALEQNYQINKDNIDIAVNSDEALDFLEKGTSYRLCLIDYQLGSEKGDKLAEKINNLRDENTHIVIMSQAPIAENVEQWAFAFKTLDEIFDAIDAYLQGKSARKSLLFTTSQSASLQGLTSSVMSATQISDARQNVLKWLHEQAGVTHCFLLKLDHIQQDVSILNAEPPFESHEKWNEAQDGLFYSPAAEIIESENPIIRNNIDLQQDKRYKNFFPSLYFESFAGFPVHLPGMPSQYGLVLLSDLSEKFVVKKTQPLYQSMDIAANFLSAILEREFTIDIMQRYRQIYEMGLLLSDFVHEIRHEFNAFDIQFKALDTLLFDYPEYVSQSEVAAWAKKTKEHFESMERLADAYSQQIQHKFEKIDVNNILEKAAKKLEGFKTRQGIAIILRKGEKIPPVFGISLHLEQVITNLLLNAAQMIDLEQEKWDIYKSKRSIPSLHRGNIFAETVYNKVRNSVEIHITDNGPGIHWREQHQIFSQGFSSRGGAGLGLHISQNAISRMGGRLTLQDSILFEGSVFEIELPVALEEDKGNGKKNSSS
jgi:signal transduction histidine kinase/predicted RNA-binding protein with RPS1 domain/CheY-like chemotaxis protein